MLAVIDRLGHGIRQTAGAYVMNQQDWILVAHLPATIDDFLCPALHLGVTALH